jgi:hypothetical protein
MSDELVEQLQAWGDLDIKYHHDARGKALHQAANEIERLSAELERRKYDRIHTCHAECQREACVLRREVDALRAQLARDANPVCGTLGDSDGDDGA